MIVVVVEEVHGEDGLATVVSGLVLGCLLVLPDHHSGVVVRSGVVRTSPARQQERAKPCHPVDAGLAVARRRVATRLSNRTVVTLGTGHCRWRCLFGILGSRPVFALMMGGLSSASPLTVARRARKRVLYEEDLKFGRVP